MQGAPRNQQWLGMMPINPLSYSQYGIPERYHGIGNLSQLVNSSVLRVHISMI